MKIIKSDYSQDFNGSHRKYYDLPSARIIDVKHFDNTKESWHVHLLTTEVLFILEGKIEARTHGNIRKIVNENEVVSFESNEWHIIKPLTPTTRILAFKYINNSKSDTLDTIKDDWKGL